MYMYILNGAIINFVMNGNKKRCVSQELQLFVGFDKHNNNVYSQLKHSNWFFNLRTVDECFQKILKIVLGK